MKFRQELAYIKEQKIQNIVKYPQKLANSESSFKEVSKFKEEMDCLMKDVCFDLYDRNTVGDKNPSQGNFDFEESLEKLLDGKILNLIKEKDYLLQQKDDVIGSLEEKNQKIFKEVVNKMFFLLMEKDKALRSKDSLIIHLKTKIQDGTLIDLDKQLSQLLEKVNSSFDQKNPVPIVTLKPQKQENLQQQQKHNHMDFINVNSVD